MPPRDQLDLFSPAPDLPEGFVYRESLISGPEEADLVRQIQTLPIEDFRFHGFTGKRRVVSFGWRYDFEGARLQKTNDMPPFLTPLRARIAAFAHLDPSSFQHVLVTEYAPGAGIGWHVDKRVFHEVAGVSLLSPCKSDGSRSDAATTKVSTTWLAKRLNSFAASDRSSAPHAVLGGHRPRRHSSRAALPPGGP